MRDDAVRRRPGVDPGNAAGETVSLPLVVPMPLGRGAAIIRTGSLSRKWMVFFRPRKGTRISWRRLALSGKLGGANRDVNGDPRRDQSGLRKAPLS